MTAQQGSVITPLENVQQQTAYPIIEYSKHLAPIIAIKGKQLEAQANISRSSRYEKLDPRSPRFDPTFPKPIKLGASIRFIQSEVNDWISARMAAQTKSRYVTQWTKPCRRSSEKTRPLTP
jgi:prophage regulatory protein